MATRGREVALNLYRNILRSHKRHLPTEMRSLGDAYVKSEFKMHKAVSNTSQVDEFFVAWEQYLDQLSQTGRRNASVSAGSLDDSKGIMINSGFGQSLPSDMELTEEQQSQLEKLKDEATQKDRTN